MAKKPNVPCAGCGKLLWGGSSSLPAGQRMCQPCRREQRNGERGWRRKAERACAVCSATFRPWHNPQSACSRACAYSEAGRALWSQGHRQCEDCPAEVVAPRRRCDTCAGVHRRARWRRKNAVRRGAAHIGRTMAIGDLGERDGWRCHLCRKRVTAGLRSPHPQSPTFDHLIPVSAGGTDAPENLRLAHRVCNSRRGARGTVQLLLVG